MKFGVVATVILVMIALNMKYAGRPVYSGNPNTSITMFNKKCEPVEKKYLGPTGRKQISLAAYHSMVDELKACVDRQAHGRPTVANSRGGFNGWIPNVFLLGNANEGK